MLEYINKLALYTPQESLTSHDWIVPGLANHGHHIPLQFGPNQRIHLGHVAAQPEEPTASGGQHQDTANQVLMRSFRGHNGHSNAHAAPQGSEKQHGKESGAHFSISKP